MSQLKNLHAKLLEFFGESWWIKHDLVFDKDQIEDAKVSLTKFTEELAKLEDYFFDCLNISIIRGEYVEEQNTKLEIEEIKYFLHNLNAPFFLNDPPDIISDYFFIEGFENGFLNPLKYVINQYSEFYHSFELRLKHPEKNYLIKYDRGIMSMRWLDSFDDESRPNLEIFRQNLIVANCDHWLSNEDKKINLLIEANNVLSNYESVQEKEYTGLIKLKAEFLVAKISLRNKRENYPEPVYSVINGVLSEIERSNIFLDEAFNAWIDFAYVHYELSDDWRNKIANSYSEIHQREISDLNILELHRCIKYYKDVNVSPSLSLKKLKELRNEISARRTVAIQTGSVFDRYALSICWNYAVNNEFSKACSTSEISSDEIEKLYLDIVEIQSESDVRNFFPQTKYLEYLLSNLKKEFEEKRALHFVDNARTIIERCKEINNTYERNVEWSKRNYIYVFQLPFKECCLSFKEFTIDRLFIFSTFLLPLPKLKYTKEYHENLGMVNQFEASIRVFENIRVDLEAHESWLTESKEKETRTMEILAIFTAIIAFVAASIPSFQFITEPKQVGFFILALSTSFILFVSLFIVAIRSKIKFSAAILIILVLLFLAGFLWFAFALE